MLPRNGFRGPKTHLPKEETKETMKKKKMSRREIGSGKDGEIRWKKQRQEIEIGGFDFFDRLPDDLIVFILSKLSSSAESRSDLINVLITCKRLKGIGLHPIVLSKASPKCYIVRARNWSESAHRFTKLCADAGNIEACYTLGMIRFYCLTNRASGASLIAKAAIGSYAPALYSLSVIQFNGSGGSKNDKDLRAGVALCARAAFFGHVDALRELGHILQDGYGVPQNIAKGRRLLVQANARELASALSKRGSPSYENEFLAEWFGQRWGPGGEHEGLRLCSQADCGRPETRPHEFRRCSVCGSVNYCSRACQARDWKIRHKMECLSMDRWLDQDEDLDNDVVDDDDEKEENEEEETMVDENFELSR